MQDSSKNGKDSVMQEFTRILEGDTRLASYAYELINTYFIDYPIDSGEIISGELFNDWAIIEADEDESAYKAYYGLRDFAKYVPSAGMIADTLFEQLLVSYVNSYIDENYDVSEALYKKGDIVDGFGTVEFVVPTADNAYFYYFADEYGNYEPHYYDYENQELI